MLIDVVEAHAEHGFKLRLKFEDGVAGTLDVTKLVSFRGVFAPLCDAAYFAQVRVDPELGTVVWPNGADLDPDVLYAAASGRPLPQFEPAAPGGPAG